MASISDQLKENPAAKELLANQKAIRQLLADPETRKVLSSLQKKNIVIMTTSPTPIRTPTGKPVWSMLLNWAWAIVNTI